MRSGVTPGCFSTGSEMYGGETMSYDVVSVGGGEPVEPESSP
jgi:hypothetical protein